MYDYILIEHAGGSLLPDEWSVSIAKNLHFILALFAPDGQVHRQLNSPGWEGSSVIGGNRWSIATNGRPIPEIENSYLEFIGGGLLRSRHFLDDG
ncbi:MAG: hypothetical protein IPJ98_21105 [Bryobacterales bacterium]|nr:hypothetical protein [Bryobacterales bacterium]